MGVECGGWQGSFGDEGAAVEVDEEGAAGGWFDADSAECSADGNAHINAAGRLLPREPCIEHQVVDDVFRGGDHGVVAVAIGNGSEV